MKPNNSFGATTEQDEIAQTVLFLASGNASAFIGNRVLIDGGFAIQQILRDIAV